MQADNDACKSDGDGDTIGETGHGLTVRKRDVSRRVHDGAVWELSHCSKLYYPPWICGRVTKIDDTP